MRYEVSEGLFIEGSYEAIRSFLDHVDLEITLPAVFKIETGDYVYVSDMSLHQLRTALLKHLNQVVERLAQMEHSAFADTLYSDFFPVGSDSYELRAEYDRRAKNRAREEKESEAWALDETPRLLDILRKGRP